MNRQTAESIVDVYGWAVELANEVEDKHKPKADGLCDALRDFLILSLSEHDTRWQFGSGVTTVPLTSLTDTRGE